MFLLCVHLWRGPFGDLIPLDWVSERLLVNFSVCNAALFNEGLAWLGGMQNATIVSQVSLQARRQCRLKHMGRSASHRILSEGYFYFI
jgi:hypothetical protein